MATSFSDPATNSPSRGPAWASCLGVVAIVFGIFLTATHGNEWMKQAVIAQPASSEQVAEADCPEDELEEEGISLAECEQLVANIETMTVSRPDWFRGFQMGLAALGTVVAFGSVIIGAALTHYRHWAPAAAILTFGALAAIDIVGFIAVVNAGPLLRALYLWNILLWFLIHMIMTVGAVAGRRSETIDRQIGSQSADGRQPDPDPDWSV
ncbi:MAG: hypothetical protein H0W33_09785 [Gammaproteobacteria bacterium]|nr:hypothetical protein [Gammaproteobacteria bacterium]